MYHTLYLSVQCVYPAFFIELLTKMCPEVFHELDSFVMQFLPEFNVTIRADGYNEVSPVIIILLYILS